MFRTQARSAPGVGPTAVPHSGAPIGQVFGITELPALDPPAAPGKIITGRHGKIVPSLFSAVLGPMPGPGASIAAAAANSRGAPLGGVPRVFKLAALDTRTATAVIERLGSHFFDCPHAAYLFKTGCLNRESRQPYGPYRLIIKIWS